MITLQVYKLMTTPLLKVINIFSCFLLEVLKQWEFGNETPLTMIYHIPLIFLVTVSIVTLEHL